MAAAPPAGAGEAPPEEAPSIPSLESTQAVAPVAAAAVVAGRESRIVCPECYAPNPPGNGYCQECGSALPVTSARQAASRTAPAQPGQQTAVMAPEIAAVGAAQPAYPGAVARARGEKSFGVSDILAASTGPISRPTKMIWSGKDAGYRVPSSRGRKWWRGIMGPRYLIPGLWVGENFRKTSKTFFPSGEVTCRH